MRSTMTAATSPHRHISSPQTERGHEVTYARPVGRYDLLTRALHWVFALVIIYASVVGYALGHITNLALRNFLSHLNMSFATVLIVLFPLRVFWRVKRKAPPPLPGISPWQRRLAHGVHSLLYITIGCVLASGYLMVPDGYRFFGIVAIPTPFARGPLTDALFLLHRGACAVLASLVLLHVLAVIKHQAVARLPVLSRML